jgi:hypothetical protein
MPNHKIKESKKRSFLTSFVEGFLNGTEPNDNLSFPQEEKLIDIDKATYDIEVLTHHFLECFVDIIEHTQEFGLPTNIFFSRIRAVYQSSQVLKKMDLSPLIQPYFQAVMIFDDKLAIYHKMTSLKENSQKIDFKTLDKIFLVSIFMQSQNSEQSFLSDIKTLDQITTAQKIYLLHLIQLLVDKSLYTSLQAWSDSQPFNKGEHQEIQAAIESVYEKNQKHHQQNQAYLKQYQSLSRNLSPSHAHP